MRCLWSEERDLQSAHREVRSISPSRHRQTTRNDAALIDRARSPSVARDTNRALIGFEHGRFPTAKAPEIQRFEAHGIAKEIDRDRLAARTVDRRGVISSAHTPFGHAIDA